MRLTKQEIARSAIRHAGKYFPHLLSVSKRYGPRAKDIADRYLKSAPALSADPSYNNAEFIQELINSIRSEFGHKGAAAKKKKKEIAAKKATRERHLKLEAEKAKREDDDRKRQTSLPL